MELLVTKVSVLEMLGYHNLFQFRGTEFLISGNDLLPFVLIIKHPSHSLTSKHQIIGILMSYSELLLDFVPRAT